MGPPRRCEPYFTESAGATAKLLARPDGPRIGAPTFDGWDTHADEGALNGGLAAFLGRARWRAGGDRDQYGPAWRDTVLVVVTEFGRTARINGTDGTDHGTATVALLAGGALKGGRVIADRPGLKAATPAGQPRPQGHRSRACSASTCASTSAPWRPRCSRITLAPGR